MRFVSRVWSRFRGSPDGPVIPSRAESEISMSWCAKHGRLTGGGSSRGAPACSTDATVTFARATWVAFAPAWSIYRTDERGARCFAAPASTGCGRRPITRRARGPGGRGVWRGRRDGCSNRPRSVRPRCPSASSGRDIASSRPRRAPPGRRPGVGAAAGSRRTHTPFSSRDRGGPVHARGRRPSRSAATTWNSSPNRHAR